MSTGHHACESDYDRPADVALDPHGHDAREDGDDPERAEIKRLWSLVKAERQKFALHWLLHRKPHPDACARCKGSMGAAQKCRECKYTGAKAGTPLRQAEDGLRAFRDRGVSTYLKQGEVL